MEHDTEKGTYHDALSDAKSIPLWSIALKRIVSGNGTLAEIKKNN